MWQCGETSHDLEVQAIAITRCKGTATRGEMPKTHRERVCDFTKASTLCPKNYRKMGAEM